MRANQEQLLEKMAKYLLILVKVQFTYQLNTRIKDYVYPMSQKWNQIHKKQYG